MGSSYFITYGGNRVTFPGTPGPVAWKAPSYIYKELWNATTVNKNDYTITLTDSIANYDELIVYGSANRDGNFILTTENRFTVIPNAINECGCFYAGRWNTASTYILVNGTDMRLSGNSGYIGSSYFCGQGNNTTTWTQNVFNTGRPADLHPYKIVGVKGVE